jgi:hypothetical protein
MHGERATPHAIVTLRDGEERQALVHDEVPAPHRQQALDGIAAVGERILIEGDLPGDQLDLTGLRLSAVVGGRETKSTGDPAILDLAEDVEHAIRRDFPGHRGFDRHPTRIGQEHAPGCQAKRACRARDARAWWRG